MPQIIEVPGHGPVEFPDGMTDEQIVAAIRKNSMAPKPEKKYGAKDLLAGQDAMAAQASGMVAGPISGLAGIAGSILPGPTGQGADWSKRTAETLTYQPRTKLGEQVTQLASIPGQVIGGIGNAVGDKVAEVSPFLGAWANGAINAAPMALSLRSSRPTGALAEEQARNAMRDNVLRNAQEAGMVVPPSAVNPTFLGNRLESIAGKAAIGQQAALRNQAVINNLAGEQIGVPPNTPLSRAVLEGRKDVLSAPYREARGIDPAVSQMVDDLKNARLDAGDYWRAYRGPAGRPEDRVNATNASNRVNSIESQIESAAQNAGTPGLVDRLRHARRDIAQVHDVENSVNAATGSVSAPVLGRRLDSGAPLSGNLRTIAEFEQAFPQYAREGERIPTPGVSKSEALASALLGGLGGASMGIPGVAMAGLPLISPAIRAALLSRTGQRMLATPDYSPMVSDPYLRGILASSSWQPRGDVPQ